MLRERNILLDGTLILLIVLYAVLCTGTTTELYVEYFGVNTQYLPGTRELVRTSSFISPALAALLALELLTLLPGIKILRIVSCVLTCLAAVWLPAIMVMSRLFLESLMGGLGRYDLCITELGVLAMVLGVSIGVFHVWLTIRYCRSDKKIRAGKDRTGKK